MVYFFPIPTAGTEYTVPTVSYASYGIGDETVSAFCPDVLLPSFSFLTHRFIARDAASRPLSIILSIRGARTYPTVNQIRSEK